MIQWNISVRFFQILSKSSTRTGENSNKWNSTIWNVFRSKRLFETRISVWNWSEESYHISLISKLGVPLGSHNTEPNWWNYTQRNYLWFVQFWSWWKWTHQNKKVNLPKINLPSKVDDCRTQKWTISHLTGT